MMKDQPQGVFLIISLLILSLGISYAGSKIHDGLTDFKSYDKSVRVKGLAMQDVRADVALWPISYAETGNNLEALQEIVEKKGNIVESFFQEYGMAKDQIELQQVNVQDLMANAYRQLNPDQSRYIITQTYLVRTEDIDAMSNAAKNIGTLIKRGVVLAQAGSSTPTYLYTKLNDIKPQMLAAATQNAKDAAEEFSKQTGQKVTDIKSASQGVFQIMPRDETYTVPEAQQINKTVRVVSTIEFYLD
ncbi:MAG: SIMPL domain-containing protein [Alphaproteobacteria bacterium]|nr:SIMPL domain-containing protein [Alphaproteobacteria bacterium]NCQ88534.1 SIMPL domain-containing protein [Alphaproteobacteria bacterium]NCT06077.1 SIMPL domain-containing protein [Alphaproteobacteria bacterium]